MDAHDGQLRLATTVREFSTPESTNAMFVLQPDGDRLEIVGQQTGLAHGEQIYSVRFAGDRAYVVTFRTIDPFFVFDLSDPTDPVALGELKITGFSNYLHVVDENHVLGVGRETDESGAAREMQLSLFNVSDPAQPTIVDRYNFDDTASSPLLASTRWLGNHHAVAYFAASQSFVMPVYTVQRQPGDFRFVPWHSRFDVEMQVFDIDPASGITLRGQMEYARPFDPAAARAVRVDETLYAVSPYEVIAAPLVAPSDTDSRLSIADVTRDDLVETRGGRRVRIDPLGNDIAFPFGRLHVANIVQPDVGGVVEIDDQGEVHFVADRDFFGTVHFQY
ncbi:MAG: beta-propeller domain-containing protein, partial [Planctomycetota bacterium]